RALIFAALVYIFDVDVLHVRPEIRKSPSDPLVVPDDDVGQPGNGEAHHVKAWLLCIWLDLKLRLVPDVGNAMAEVHIIREERFACGGVRAGDHPIVRARDQTFHSATEWRTALRFGAMVCLYARGVH